MRLTFAAVAAFAVALGVLCATRPGLAIAATCLCLILVAWRTQVGRLQRLPWGSEGATVLYWEVVAFPTVLGLRSSHLRFALIGIAILVVSVLLRQARPKLDWRPLRWSLLVGLALFLPILRAEPSWQMVLSVLAAVFIFRLALVAEARAVVSSLVYGIGVYLAANAVLFYGFGLTSPTAEIRMSGFVGGSTAERAFFPLSVSVNLPPNMAAIYIVGALPLFAATKSARHRWALAAGTVAAVAVLLGGSSRTSFLTVAVVAAAALLVPRLLLRTAAIAVAVAGVSGFIYIWIAGAVGSTLAFLASFVPHLDRGSSSAATFSSLGGRREIWTNVLHAWADAPLFEKLFGYGSEGQVASGVSLTYSYLFRGWLDDPYRGTAHNSTLQMLLDAGAVGVILFLGLLIATVIGWSRLPGSAGLAGTSMLVVLTLVSLTEVATVPGPGQETFWVLACLAMVAPVAATSPSGRRGVGDEAARCQPGQQSGGAEMRHRHRARLLRLSGNG